jgi:hypothetical protein
MAKRGIVTSREWCALKALAVAPVTREQLDRICGVSNSPDIIYQLRSVGLSIPCVRVEPLYRKGSARRMGVYQLTSSDADLVHKLFAVFPQDT